MKAARMMCLVLGGVGLFLAALALLFFYIESMRPLSTRTEQVGSTLESSVTAAEDLPSLKIVCLSLARFQVSTYPEFREQSKQVKRFMQGTLFFLFGWGTVSCLAFFYVFYVLRKNAKGAHSEF